jgi:hypothetical protein
MKFFLIPRTGKSELLKLSDYKESNLCLAFHSADYATKQVSIAVSIDVVFSSRPVLCNLEEEQSSRISVSLKLELNISLWRLKGTDVNQIKVSSAEVYFMTVMGLCLSYEAIPEQ